ncbi:efflux RND transporter permease subunit [Armatimonas rosea]|uniref:Cobalt-zinc-cadmium resistance protein CzcA n=1 Tax=Armatimonas rosea TaxID=685828 RepID=A0A7W9SX98_ARMRO|nr:CusA/CzcA family heavy metal efflux RND transporter [Armatimonas rosea]MBB6053919.1 cobalt-zinc-cadmium resistance protein CzcA [Armatimonas rosea]
MLERILNFSLAQRFLVILAALALVGFGVVSWQQLTLDAVPDITTNQVQINTNTGGMAPPEVEKLVTFPVETAMGGLPGVQGVRSLSQYGLSQVTITFSDHTDTYFARQLVTERLNSVREQLPAGVAAPELAPVSTGLGEVFMFSVDSDRLTPMELRTLFDWQIKPQLRTVIGVAEVNATGGYEKQYEVQPDPQRLRARGVSLDALLEALKKNNANVGGGFIERQGEQLLVRSVGAVTGIEDIEKIVVTAERGTPIFVRDVAKVGLGTPARTGLATRDGKETVLGIVMMLKGANGRTVASAARERLATIQKQMPEGVTLTPVYDRSHLVNQAVGTVQKSLVEGGIFVLAVLLLLLGNVRGAVIVALAIPLSMLFAFINMNRFGISGNLMSLGAIDFGLIVDGAVVMVEHAVAELAHARQKLGRTLTRDEVRFEVGKASRDVAQPVAFAVTIITVVYLPILALEGTEGKMFHPMAFTVIFALIGALILTMTLVPALCSLLLSRDTREGKNPVMGFFAKVYQPALEGALRLRGLVVGLAIGLVALSLILFSRLGSEFVPQLDEGDAVVQPVRLRTVGEKETIRLVTAMEKRLKEFPEVITVFSRSGTPEVATDPMPMSLTDSIIALKPKSEWRKGLTKEKLIAEMEEALKDVPGQGYGFTQPIQMRFSELVAGVKADVGIKVFGEDLDTLKKNADAIASVLGKVPGSADVSVEQVDDVPVLQLTVDREAAARVGVSAAEVQEWIGSAFTGEPLGQVIEGDKRFDLVVRLPQSVRGDPEAVKNLPIVTPSGGTVTLGSLASFETVGQPAQISRESGRRRVVVQCNVRGADLGSFVQAAQTAIEKQVKLPSGYYLEWGGQFENLQRARARLTVVVPLALSLIFLLLFLSFGSLKQAALIFTGVPLAVTGGVLGLVVRSMPFSISAGIGFIALSGVAVLNGVVLVSAINRLRREGLDIPEAVREGARSRLRPVLMTALVASLGFVPMALNMGIGAEVQRPLATVVIGGIASSTLLTLLVLPVLYILFEKQQSVDVEVSPEKGDVL